MDVMPHNPCKSSKRGQQFAAGAGVTHSWRSLAQRDRFFDDLFQFRASGESENLRRSAGRFLVSDRRF